MSDIRAKKCIFAAKVRAKKCDYGKKRHQTAPRVEAKVLKNNARNACRIISFLYICSPQLKRRGIINLKILNNDKRRIDA